MTLLSNKLQRWEQAGLLSSTQHAAILAFETENPQRANWWLYSFMVLGASIIGLGIISLIAANWEMISDGVKLGADFALLALLAGGIYAQYQNQQQGVWFEVFIVSFLLLCLASIGLIAQIFHTGGKWYHALLFWAVITSALSLFARNLFTRFLWITLFLHALVWTIIQISNTSNGYYFDEIPALALFTPLLCALLYGLSQYFTALRGYGSSLFFWLQISAVFALALIDISRSDGDSYHLTSGFLPSYLVAGLLVISILLQREYKLLNKILLLAVLGLLLAYYHPTLLFNGESYFNAFDSESSLGNAWWNADDIRAPLLTLGILFLYAIHAGNIGHQRTFNLVTFLIGARFVILYFQAMGGLAATGIGLIVSGFLIIGIAWVWHKGRDHFRTWTKGTTA